MSLIKVEGNANSHVGSLSCVTVSFSGAGSCHCGDVAHYHEKVEDRVDAFNPKEVRLLYTDVI